jgi:hypothetical protein
VHIPTVRVYLDVSMLWQHEAARNFREFPCTWADVTALCLMLFVGCGAVSNRQTFHNASPCAKFVEPCRATWGNPKWYSQRVSAILGRNRISEVHSRRYVLTTVYTKTEFWKNRFSNSSISKKTGLNRFSNFYKRCN